MQDALIFGREDHTLDRHEIFLREHSIGQHNRKTTLYKDIYRDLQRLIEYTRNPKTTIHGNIDILRKISLQELSMN